MIGCWYRLKLLTKPMLLSQSLEILLNVTRGMSMQIYLSTLTENDYDTSLETIKSAFEDIA